MALKLIDGYWSKQADLSLYDTDFEVHDLTDGSWSLYDPSNLIQSVSYSGGYNEFTWNGLGVASNNFFIGGGTTLLWPRWYKPLQIDGNNITTTDLLTHHSIVEIDQTTIDFSPSFCCSVAQQPSSSASNVVLHAGGYGRRLNPTGQYGYGLVMEATQYSLGASTAQKGFATNTYGANYLGVGQYLVLDNSNLRLGSNVVNTSTGLTAAQQVYLMIGAGTRDGTTTITSGNKTKCYFASKQVKWSP